MKEIRIASRYAKALFDLALEHEVLDRVREDMDLVAGTVSENRELLLMLRSPVIKASIKKKVLRSLFGRHIHALTAGFMDLMTDHDREEMVVDIAEKFTEFYRKHKNILTASIITAAPLDKTVRDRIVTLLTRQTGATIEMTEEVDGNIIGGFLLRFGDRQYDASIRKRLQELQREFDINLFVRKI
ncbi:MAG: ATP synthase F1 subunit delta [Bacteroidales bacterium]|nr:ATP synthase F1 subunit delta [Bacteroidales bacterium]